MKDRRDEAAHVARAIAEFLEGTGGEHDWDDFTSLALHDRALDGIRREAAAVDLPVDDEGEAILLRLCREAEKVSGGGG